MPREVVVRRLKVSEPVGDIAAEVEQLNQRPENDGRRYLMRFTPYNPSDPTADAGEIYYVEGSRREARPGGSGVPGIDMVC